MRLTEQSIRKLPPPPKGNRIHYDDQMKGLVREIGCQRAGSRLSNLRRSAPWPWQTTQDSPPTASMSETMT
jgi:hypothetical protein